MLEMGAIAPSSRTDLVLNSIYTVAKKDSTKRRPVVNLRWVNSHLQKIHFKMSTMRDVKMALTPGCYMAKIDLTDCFWGLPVSREDQRALAFTWRGQNYVFKCLPFGLSLAPMYITKLYRHVVEYLQARGHRVIIYIDDMLILGNTKERCAESLQATLDLMNDLGALVNAEKSCLCPAQIVDYLGFSLDSRTMTVTAPAKKVRNLKKQLRSTIRRQQVSARDLASVLGKINAMSDALFPVTVHTTHLQPQTQDFIPWPRLEPLDPYYDEGHRRYDVVGRQCMLAQRTADKRARGESTSHDGRFRLGVGGDDQARQRPFFEQLGRLFLEGRFEEAYQLQRTFGNPGPTQEFPYTRAGQDDRSGGRQHYGPILHQEHGGSQAASSSTCGGNLLFHVSQQRITPGVSHTGSVECAGRPGITETIHVPLSRLPAQPSPLQEDKQDFRSPHDRCVRNVSRQAAPPFRVEGAPTRGDVGGRNVSLVGEREPLGQPSLLDDREDSEQDQEGEGDGNNFSPTLASSVLVSPASGDDGGTTPPPPGDERRLFASYVQREMPKVGDTRLEGLREALKERGVEDSTFQTLVKAWEPGTLANYETYWKRWAAFARETNKDPFVSDGPTLAAWLAFLVASKDILAKEGAVEKASTVVKSTWALLEDPCVLIKKIAKAASKLNGPKAKGKYQDIWDIS